MDARAQGRMAQKHVRQLNFQHFLKLSQTELPNQKIMNSTKNLNFNLSLDVFLRPAYLLKRATKLHYTSHTRVRRISAYARPAVKLGTSRLTT